MLEADVVRLKHMLDAAKEIIDFTEQKTQGDFNSDRKLQLSVVHLLEIVGEAGAGVSDGVQQEYPQIPWKSIIGMRNRLIHGYFDIDLIIVYKTAIQDIPPLVKKLEKIVLSQDI